MTLEMDSSLRTLSPRDWKEADIRRNLSEIESRLSLYQEMQQAPNLFSFSDQDKELLNLPPQAIVRGMVVVVWLRFRLTHDQDEKKRALEEIENQYPGEFRDLVQSGKMVEIRNSIIHEKTRKGY